MNTRNGILFLDVDGVLNSERWFQSDEYKTRRVHFRKLYGDALKNADRSEEDKHKAYIELKETHIDPVALAGLNKMLVELDLSIVLSSTWRIADFTREALAQSGIDSYSERYIGRTPSSRCGECRGDDIQRWLTENDYQGNFVILDDDPDMGHLKNQLVQTSWFDGFKEETARKIASKFLVSDKNRATL